MASESSNNDKNSTRPSPSSVLDPFLKSIGGADCDRPACDDTKSALVAALERVGRASATNNISHSDGSNKQIESKLSSENLPSSYRSCPPTRDELGVSTWTLIHSMAAWYPQQPSSQDKQSMSDFITALAQFYPCSWCATDFQKNIKMSPPRTDTREDLCVWFCEQHNIVNEKLGKPLFLCSMNNLDERWRKSTNPNCKK